MTNLQIIDAICRHEELRPITACPSCGKEAASVLNTAYPLDTMSWECMNDECEKIEIINIEYDEWDQEMKNLYQELDINESNVFTRYYY